MVCLKLQLLASIILIGISYPEIFISGLSNTIKEGKSSGFVGSPKAMNFIANQRPRFKIPRGNLSYFRNPHWEILYYLKFGTFPEYSQSSPWLNQTEYLRKMKVIKELQDKVKTESRSRNTIVDPEAGKIYQGNSNIPRVNLEMSSGNLSSKEENTLHYPLHMDSPFPPIISDDDTIQQRAVTRYPGNKYLLKTASEMSSLSVPFLTIGKKKEKMDSILGKRSSNQNSRDESFYNLLRSRVAKETGTNFVGNLDGLFPNNDVEASLDGLAVETIIDRKVNRKFQTQGWK